MTTTPPDGARPEQGDRPEFRAQPAYDGQTELPPSGGSPAYNQRTYGQEASAPDVGGAAASSAAASAAYAQGAYDQASYDQAAYSQGAYAAPASNPYGGGYAPYGAPAAPPSTSRTLSLWGLILGISSIVLPLGLNAIAGGVLSGMGLAKEPRGKTMAIWGLVTSGLGFLWAPIFWFGVVPVILIAMFGAAYMGSGY